MQSSGWKTLRLGDFVSLQRGHDLPSRIRVDEGIPVMGSAGVSGYHNEIKAKGPGVTIGRSGVGSMGVVCYSPVDYWPLNTTLYVKDFHGNNPLFAYYFLKTINFRNLNSGSAQASLNRNIVHRLEITVPPRNIQDRIADILSSLDAQIDLLHRQNKTLETIAQTLFHHWFVDSAANAWEEKPLDEAASFLNGLACQKYPPENDMDRLPVLKIRELRTGISDKTDWATKNVPPQYIVENGDVIFSWSGSLMVKIWNGAQCVLNQHLFKVTSDFPKWFYYFWTIHYLQKFIAIAESKATTMGHIKRRDLSSSMVLVPSSDELAEMDISMSPLLDKIITNYKQSRTLENLRDTLLPKLMSGMVRMQDQG